MATEAWKQVARKIDSEVAAAYVEAQKTGLRVDLNEVVAETWAAALEEIGTGDALRAAVHELLGNGADEHRWPSGLSDIDALRQLVAGVNVPRCDTCGALRMIEMQAEGVCLCNVTAVVDGACPGCGEAVLEDQPTMLVGNAIAHRACGMEAIRHARNERRKGE